MNKPTPSKLEQELEATQDLMATRSLLGRLQIEKKTNKDTRLVKRLFEKTQKLRVRKPKPKRRLNHRVVVVSIGGQNVEDENDYKKVG